MYHVHVKSLNENNDYDWKMFWLFVYLNLRSHLCIQQMLLSKETYSAFRLYIILSVCVFPGNWTHNLFALLIQCSTTEPQEHNQCCWLIHLLLLFVHIVNISGINCCFRCIGFYYMDTNAHTLVWGPILTINYDFSRLTTKTVETFFKMLKTFTVFFFCSAKWINE